MLCFKADFRDKTVLEGKNQRELAPWAAVDSLTVWLWGTL